MRFIKFHQTEEIKYDSQKISKDFLIDKNSSETCVTNVSLKKYIQKGNFESFLISFVSFLKIDFFLIVGITSSILLPRVTANGRLRFSTG